MGNQEREARRERRQWLLRVSCQALQRQQGGPPAGLARAVPAGMPCRPAPGWVGQNSPENFQPWLDGE